MNRIVVVGTTGSGKTTLAKALTQRLGLPHIELDVIHWKANWTPTPTPQFREEVTAALAGDCWVVDGNYSVVRDIVWHKADTVIWLDYTIGQVLWQLTRRSLRRSFLREPLWNGNVESFSAQFLSRDSLYIWAFKTHWRKRRRYRTLLRDPSYRHLQMFRLRSPSETQGWLRALEPDSHPPRSC